MYKSHDLTELIPRIAVIGVGGAGGNALKNMQKAGLLGVEFVACNTDAQAISKSEIKNWVQLGVKSTKGLGAGSQPAVGKKAAEESVDEIIDKLTDIDMVFIASGMGGGTGTGASPVIAKLAKERDILTVAVVTTPFEFEGALRKKYAREGIIELEKHVDTLLVLPNQNLFNLVSEQTSLNDAFDLADHTLYNAVRSVTDLMMRPGLINLDFADVQTVMQDMGYAIMGTGEASGDDRAYNASLAAISNPLLGEVSIYGAKGLLINITGGDDMTLVEVDRATSTIREQVDQNANIIVGASFEEEVSGSFRVSVVATGLSAFNNLSDKARNADILAKKFDKENLGNDFNRDLGNDFKDHADVYDDLSGSRSSSYENQVSYVGKNHFARNYVKENRNFDTQRNIANERNNERNNKRNIVNERVQSFNNSQESPVGSLHNKIRERIMSQSTDKEYVPEHKWAYQPDHKNTKFQHMEDVVQRQAQAREYQQTNNRFYDENNNNLQSNKLQSNKFTRDLNSGLPRSNRLNSGNVIRQIGQRDNKLGQRQSFEHSVDGEVNIYKTQNNIRKRKTNPYVKRSFIGNFFSSIFCGIKELSSSTNETNKKNYTDENYVDENDFYQSGDGVNAQEIPVDKNRNYSQYDQNNYPVSVHENMQRELENEFSEFMHSENHVQESDDLFAKEENMDRRRTNRISKNIQEKELPAFLRNN